MISTWCAMLIKDGDGLLVTCDAIQNYGDYSYNNLPATIMMPILGFSRTTLVGPIWLRLMTPEGRNLEPEFMRLLEFKFERLIAAHGTYLGTGAYAAVQKAVATGSQRHKSTGNGGNKLVGHTRAPQASEKKPAEAGFYWR